MYWQKYYYSATRRHVGTQFDFAQNRQENYVNIRVKLFL